MLGVMHGAAMQRTEVSLLLGVGSTNSLICRWSQCMYCAGVEIACNLLDEGTSSVADVLRRVSELSTDAGVQAVGQQLGSGPGSGPYVLGRTRSELVALAARELGTETRC